MVKMVRQHPSLHLVICLLFTCQIFSCHLFSPLSESDILPEENQEIELLDQVLKKALKIRSTSEAQRELPSAGDTSTHPKKSRNTSVVNDAVKDEEKKGSSGRKLNHRVRSVGGREGMWTRPVLVRRGSSAHPVVTGKQSVRKSALVSTGAQQKSCDLKTTNAEALSENQSTSMSCTPRCEDVHMPDKHQKSQSNGQWYAYIH